MTRVGDRASYSPLGQQPICDWLHGRYIRPSPTNRFAYRFADSYYFADFGSLISYISRMGQQFRRKTDLPKKAAVQGGSKQDRAKNRFPFKGTCLLIPIASNGQLAKVAPINILGRDLSTSGLSFSHSLPLSTKRAIVTLGRTNGERLLLEVEVVWSKRLSVGLYESGCRLVRNFTTPSKS